MRKILLFLVFLSSVTSLYAQSILRIYPTQTEVTTTYSVLTISRDDMNKAADSITQEAQFLPIDFAGIPLDSAEEADEKQLFLSEDELEQITYANIFDHAVLGFENYFTTDSFVCKVINKYPSTQGTPSVTEFNFERVIFPKLIENDSFQLALGGVVRIPSHINISWKADSVVYPIQIDTIGTCYNKTVGDFTEGVEHIVVCGTKWKPSGLIHDVSYVEVPNGATVTLRFFDNGQLDKDSVQLFYAGSPTILQKTNGIFRLPSWKESKDELIVLQPDNKSSKILIRPRSYGGKGTGATVAVEVTIHAKAFREKMFFQYGLTRNECAVLKFSSK